MRQHWIFIFSGLIFCSLPARSQSDESVDLMVKDSIVLKSKADRDIVAGYDEEEADADSIVYPFFSSAALLFDYGKLIGLALDTESKYELGVQLDFKNILVAVAEYGIATLEPNGAYQNAAYSSEGFYYRLGLGFKYDMNQKNNFVFTARYGRSEYSDNGEINIQSPTGLYDPYTEPFDRSTSTAIWYEAVLTSETRMRKGLYLGFHLRLRIMKDYEKREPLDVYSIPGYGRTIDKSIPALNLYVKYAFERF